jgi:hypothetical protein
MPNYVPMHAQNIEQAAADRLYCKAIAEGMTPGQGGGFVYAQGSPQFVGATMGAYAIGGLIGAAIRQQHKLDNYDDCMIARGYTKQQTLTASAPTPLSPITPITATAAPVITRTASAAQPSYGCSETHTCSPSADKWREQ